LYVSFFANHEGMADYQYVVPVHADVAKRKKRNWSEPEETHLGDFFIFFSMFEVCLKEMSVSDLCLYSLIAKSGRIDVDHEDIMIIVPPIFAPKDMPEDLLYVYQTVILP